MPLSDLPVVGGRSPGRLAKPLKRSTVKRKAKRVKADHVSETRIYVQGRERRWCRCCRRRHGQSMHEIVPKSRGGTVSKTNSMWVCGDGTTKCHGFLQRHEIEAITQGHGAEDSIVFYAETVKAAEWMGIKQFAAIVSAPMRDDDM